MEGLLILFWLGSIALKIFYIIRCYQIAEHRGWSTSTAIILGFFFGLFALIGYGINAQSTEASPEYVRLVIKRLFDKILETIDDNFGVYQAFDINPEIVDETIRIIKKEPPMFIKIMIEDMGRSPYYYLYNYLLQKVSNLKFNEKNYNNYFPNDNRGYKSDVETMTKFWWAWYNKEIPILKVSK